MFVQVTAFSILVSASWCADKTFPPGFKFGVATSAYQIEGAWNVSDKGVSIWDHFTHTNPEAVDDISNGDVACDSYHKWQEDVQLVKNLGVHFYRFSISWSRLLPHGFSNYISEDGVTYYSNLINGLLENGIEPVITLYHWDMPQSLQNLGGWTNPLVVDWFADYARVIYTLYADRVKTWITINEPIVVCDASYNGLGVAPNILDPDRASYLCNKFILLAHAKAWRIFDEEFRPIYPGEASIGNHLMWFEPASPEDELAELVREYGIGRYTHAIYSEEGGWPPGIERALAEISEKQGYSRSKLPPFTQEEIQLIKGTYDFFGFNHYISRLVRKADVGEEITFWPIFGVPDLGAVLFNSPDWGQTEIEMMPINPEGLGRLLSYLKNMYGDLPFLITENGYGSFNDGLEDDDRIEYINGFLDQVLVAIHEDGVNVTGYTAWSLLDNFEWNSGYTNKFGLYHVDFNDPERTRTPRKSAEHYANIVRSNSLDASV